MGPGASLALPVADLKAWPSTPSHGHFPYATHLLAWPSDFGGPWEPQSQKTEAAEHWQKIQAT